MRDHYKALLLRGGRRGFGQRHGDGAPAFQVGPGRGHGQRVIPRGSSATAPSTSTALATELLCAGSTARSATWCDESMYARPVRSRQRMPRGDLKSRSRRSRWRSSRRRAATLPIPLDHHRPSAVYRGSVSPLVAGASGSAAAARLASGVDLRMTAHPVSRILSRSTGPAPRPPSQGIALPKRAANGAAPGPPPCWSAERSARLADRRAAAEPPFRVRFILPRRSWRGAYLPGEDGSL